MTNNQKAELFVKRIKENDSVATYTGCGPTDLIVKEGNKVRWRFYETDILTAKNGVLTVIWYPTHWTTVRINKVLNLLGITGPRQEQYKLKNYIKS